MLRGSYPFDSEDASELIQMHYAQEPLSLHIIDPKIPVLISNMISKLLKKSDDERYKSAKGIIYDIDLYIYLNIIQV